MVHHHGLPWAWEHQTILQKNPAEEAENRPAPAVQAEAPRRKGLDGWKPWENCCVLLDFMRFYGILWVMPSGNDWLDKSPNWTEVSIGKSPTMVHFPLPCLIAGARRVVNQSFGFTRCLYMFLHFARYLSLVGGLEHVFFHILGMSSSQLTNSYFSEGKVYNHQPDELLDDFPMIFPFSYGFLWFSIMKSPTILFLFCGDLWSVQLVGHAFPYISTTSPVEVQVSPRSEHLHHDPDCWDGFFSANHWLVPGWYLVGTW